MKATIRTQRALGLTAAAALFALAGCGNPGMSGPGTESAPPATATTEPTAAQTITSAPASSTPTGSGAVPAEILIKGFTYSGGETVSPGAEITVTNEDPEAHTITADTGTTFDVIIKAGSATFTAPTEPGTYPYHCSFHGNMKGTLTVK